jgi:hypothetical protein
MSEIEIRCDMSKTEDKNALILTIDGNKLVIQEPFSLYLFNVLKENQENNNIRDKYRETITKLQAENRIARNLAEINASSRDITVRQYYAAKAMQAMLSNPAYSSKDLDEITTKSFEISDGMIREQKE